VEVLGRLEVLDLGGLTLKNNLVLLVTGAKSKRGRELSGCGNREIAGVAKVVLGLCERCAGKR
jgi:hypothetical protein